MKKACIFPIFLVIPLVTSCKGVLISTSSAKNIVSNINEQLADGKNDYNKFTFTYKSVNGESKITRKDIYDANAKFYYTYTVTESRIDERWYYVKNDSSNNPFIYSCYRDNGDTDAAGSPLVSATIDTYTDDNWYTEIVDKIILTEISNQRSNVMERIDKYIAYEDKHDWNDVFFSSLNNYSICAEGKVDYVDFKYEVDDCFLGYYKHYVDDTHYQSFTCSYDRAQITYLNI